MTKVLALRYPASVDRINVKLDHLNKVFDVEDATKVKDLIGELLFNINMMFRYNYCLIKHDNKLYVIEPSDYDKNLYSRKLVNYHPLSHLI